jgi:hypothetical protein
MEDTPPAVDKAQRLLTWFRSNGGYLHPSVTIEHTQANGFRLIATEPLPENTDFVTCPLALTLSQLNLDPEEQYVPHYDSQLPLLRGKVPDHVLGYLLLIEQVVLKDKSFWYPYIDALPEKGDVPTPLWHDSGYYKNTPLEHARLERLDTLKKEHEHALSAMADADMRSSDLYNECDL